MLALSVGILLLATLLPHVASFQNNHHLIHPYGGRCGDASTLKGGSAYADDPDRTVDSIKGRTPRYAILFDDHGENEQTCRMKQPTLALFLLAACSFCYSPQLASATVPDESAASQQSSMSSLLVATYASEGSGGMPFLSPFQTPGAIPQASKYDDKEARNRAYDDAFDQDKSDRDAYYAKMALASREKKMAELKARRAELGLDGDDAPPRVGDEKVASMASLKKDLSQRDPATMTPAEFKEFQQLVQQPKETSQTEP